MYFIVYFSSPKYHLFIHKELIQMSDRCFNTLQEQNNKNTVGEAFDCKDLICNWMSEPPGCRLEHNTI